MRFTDRVICHRGVLQPHLLPCISSPLPINLTTKWYCGALHNFLGSPQLCCSVPQTCFCMIAHTLSGTEKAWKGKCSIPYFSTHVRGHFPFAPPASFACQLCMICSSYVAIAQKPVVIFWQLLIFKKETTYRWQGGVASRRGSWMNLCTEAPLLGWTPSSLV